VHDPHRRAGEEATSMKSLRAPAVIALLATALLATAPLARAQSAFEGTWRPDPQKPGPTRPPDAFELSHGMYECKSCQPAYTIKADGHDQPVSGVDFYDTLRVTIVDPHTVNRLARKNGQTVMNSTMTVSADGASLLESQVLFGMAPQPVELTIKSARAAAAPAGAHLLSGAWRRLELDLTHHDEDTTYKVTAGALSMSDRMGRSFTAKLDGSDAPYLGDPEFTTVSLKVVDPRTLEEYDKKDGKVVKISRWSIEKDGRTMHVRFDDTHGGVQQQTGHKVEANP
jgi:hypothetical protein